MLQVMAYSIAVAVALSMVGACLERMAGLYRLPRRAGWMAVMLLSVLFPAAMILLARPAAMDPVPLPAVEVSAPIATRAPADIAQPIPEFAPAPAAPTQVHQAGRSTAWRIPTPTDGQLMLAWLVASVVMVLYLGGARLALRRRAAGWKPARMVAQDVLVSEVTGPALLGVLRPRIVVPRWLQGQSPASQTLILEHERQHMLARDPLLILAGWLVIAAVPWNLPLWWQWRRVRQAVELDCDARVMRGGAEAITYAEVLLAVTRRATRSPAGALAMSEPVHALERRIAGLMPNVVRHARLQTFALLMLAVVGAGAALALEAPALPDRASGSAPTPAFAQPASTPAPFMVRVWSPVAEPPAPSMFSLALERDRPRPDGAPDAAAKARLERHYSILTEKLRAVPGLVLVTESTPGATSVPYEVAVRLGEGWQGVHIEATSALYPSYRLLWRSIDTPGPLYTPRLTALRDDVHVEDPDREMENLVQRMRLELFPPDRAFLDKRMSDFRDPQLEPDQRRQALFQLMTADRRRDSFSGAFPPRTYRPDPGLISAATDVAITANDPGLRLQIWHILGGIGTPRIDPAVLVAPAERALARETDLRVQLGLVSILGMSLADPQVRAVLDSIAYAESERNRPELVRMAARRVLTGGAGWNEYFVSRLDDPQVSDAERLDLINYAYSISGGSLAPGEMRLQLDEATERSLAGLMNKRDSTEVAVAVVGLLFRAGGTVAREEFINYLRAETGRAETGRPAADNEVRRSVLSVLAYSLRSHPEDRPLFEEVMARDHDPAMREAARQALEQTR